MDNERLELADGLSDLFRELFSNLQGGLLTQLLPLQLGRPLFDDGLRNAVFERDLGVAHRRIADVVFASFVPVDLTQMNAPPLLSRGLQSL